MLGMIGSGAIAVLWLIAPGRGLAAEAQVALPRLGAPRVHLEAKVPGVVLYREQPAAADAEPPTSRYGIPVCAAPCDQVVDGRAGQRFYLGGPDYLDSSKFQLTEQRGELTVQVAPRSPSLVRGGFFFTLTGGVMAVLAAPALFVISANQNDPVTTKVGLGVLVGGAMMLGGGIVMLVTSKTGYRFYASP